MSRNHATPLIEVGRDSNETLGAIVRTTADPTSTTPKWAVIPTWDTSPAASAHDGSFDVWNPSTKKATVISPTLPSSASVVTLSPGEYIIHVNWGVGSESPWKRIGRLKVY